jgi:hypothetical protein
MSQSMHGNTTIHTPRKHLVPTHLNLPDQVLTLWSFSLSARQLLLLLVGAGIGGTVWQHLAPLEHHALAGQVLRLLVALLPFLLIVVLACYQYAGRSLEVWLIVLVRYHLRHKRYLWRSIRHFEPHLYPPALEKDAPDREERGDVNTPLLTERKQP